MSQIAIALKNTAAELVRMCDWSITTMTIRLPSVPSDRATMLLAKWIWEPRVSSEETTGGPLILDAVRGHHTSKEPGICTTKESFKHTSIETNYWVWKWIKGVRVWLGSGIVTDISWWLMVMVVWRAQFGRVRFEKLFQMLFQRNLPVPIMLLLRGADIMVMNISVRCVMSELFARTYFAMRFMILLRCI